MIVGRVETGAARVPVVAHGPHGSRIELEAIVDTGFDGALTLPPARIEELALSFRREASATMADGSTVLYYLYSAEIDWNGKRLSIAVDAMDCEPLLGMALLNGHELRIRVEPNGVVEIKPLA